MMMVMMVMRFRMMTRMMRGMILIMGMRRRMMVIMTRMVITWINHSRSSSPSFRTGRLSNISSDSLQREQKGAIWWFVLMIKLLPVLRDGSEKFSFELAGN